MDYVPREIETDILRWLHAPEIIVIRGPRQSGKTTLLRRLSAVLEEKYGAENVHVLTFEDELERRRFEENPREVVQFYGGSGGKKQAFLLDEIQYVKNAGHLLKLLFDTVASCKIVVTGSSALDINQLGAALVGRALFFDLQPFSFAEFLSVRDPQAHRYYLSSCTSIKKPNVVPTAFLERLNRLLDEYHTFGGYPRVVLEPSVEKKKFILKNLFSTYLEKDVANLFGPQYKGKAIDMVRYLASAMGQVIKYDDISQATGLYYMEVKHILSILEQTYIIRVARPFHRNMITEIKKNPKIYFVDSGLRNVILDRYTFSDMEKGALLENYVCSLLEEPKYWRTTAKAEVDFVLNMAKEDIIPVEVKTRPDITRSFRSFVRAYQPHHGIIITREASGRRRIGGTTVYLVPAALLSA